MIRLYPNPSKYVSSSRKEVYQILQLVVTFLAPVVEDENMSVRES